MDRCTRRAITPEVGQVLAAKIIRFFRSRNCAYAAPVPPGTRGGSRVVTKRGLGMRWTRQRRRARRSQGGALAGVETRERYAARRTNDVVAYGKSVWSRHPLLVSSFRGDASSRPDIDASPIRKAMETRRNSSPRRARHKPSNHCAGKAGLFPASPVVFPLCIACAMFSTGAMGAGRHPVFPAPLSEGGERKR
jgi:hypothetical protein